MPSSNLISASKAYAQNQFYPQFQHLNLLIQSIELETDFLKINAPSYILSRCVYLVANKISQSVFYQNWGFYIAYLNQSDPLESWRKHQNQIHFAFHYKDIKKLAGRYVKEIMNWINKAFPRIHKYKKGSHAYLRTFNPKNFFKKRRKNWKISLFFQGITSAHNQQLTKRGFKRLMDYYGYRIAEKIIKERDRIVKYFQRILRSKYSGDNFAINFLKKMVLEMAGKLKSPRLTTCSPPFL